MEKKELSELLDRYVKGDCTSTERSWVENWYNRNWKIDSTSISHEEIEQDLFDIKRRLQSAIRQKIYPWIKYVVAASILLGCLGLMRYYLQPVSDPILREQIAEKPKNDILPGGNSALLVLPDGRNIALSGKQGKVVIGEDNIAYPDGSLVLNGLKMSVHQLKIEIPRGGQYQVTLSDGTKVWLNAGSSLRYPSRFNNDLRLVELEGEAYFEVAKDRDRPFRVKSQDQIIEVLGTQFNISSYSDEPVIQTTLVEGSVLVSGSAFQAPVTLKPGQQSIWNKNKGIQVKQVNVSNVIAWKQGMFSFDNLDIETIMRQLSRWYNVEVSFEGEKPNLQLWGQVYRNLNASQVLEMLTYFNLKFRIENVNGIKSIVIYV